MGLLLLVVVSIAYTIGTTTGQSDDKALRHTEICVQPKITGMCRASFLRYFHNQTSRKCEEFVYGGCDGNENRFRLEEECKRVCVDKKTCPVIPTNVQPQRGCRFKTFKDKDMCMKRTQICQNT